jgi:hypothetical protein
MKKEDLVAEVLGMMGQVTVYKDGYSNTFVYGKDDVYWYWDGFATEKKYRIFGELQKEEIFHMSLGEAYFNVNNKPCCCEITQINHPKVGERDNYEMLMIIELSRLGMDSCNVVVDFHKCFQKYDGPIFDDVTEIEDRFDILDL